MLPQMMPPAAAANPAMAHDRANTLDTRIPTTIAACWSSATARMAIPSRLRVKNSPKAINERDHPCDDVNRGDEHRTNHEGCQGHR